MTHPPAAPPRHVAPDHAGPAVLLADRQFYPVPPAPENIDIAVIFKTLAQIKRYGGAFASADAPTVGQHTLALANACDDPALALHALLHDTPEAFTGDLLWPVKQAWPGLHETWGGLDGACFTAIYAALGVDLPDAATRATLKAADLRCCPVEGFLYGFGEAACARLFARHGGSPRLDVLGRRLIGEYQRVEMLSATSVAKRLLDKLTATTAATAAQRRTT